MKTYPEFKQLIRKMGRAWVKNWLFGQAVYYIKQGKECPAWLKTYFGYLIRWDTDGLWLEKGQKLPDIPFAGRS